MKVVVIGAGIVGASIAYRLSQAGAEVTLVEAERIGGATSSVTYAWVNACEKLASEAYYRLNFAGRAAHARLASELGGQEWYPRPGVLQWQEAEAEAGGIDASSSEEKYARLKAWGYPAEMLPAGELRHLEPEIDPEAYGERPVIHYPEDGWCYATLYAGRVAGAAISRHGARLVIGRVRDLLMQGNRCTGVALEDGSRIEADVVVNCSGRWANEVLGMSGFTLPLAPTSGIVAYSEPAGLALTRGLRTPTVNLRPDGGGRLLMRAGDLDKLVDGHRPAGDFRAEAEELLARARALLPALDRVKLEAMRIAIRPQPADGYSALGQVPGTEGLYLAVTHSGVTLAPFVAEGLRQEILTGEAMPEFTEFRPGRFLKGAVQ